MPTPTADSTVFHVTSLAPDWPPPSITGADLVASTAPTRPRHRPRTRLGATTIRADVYSSRSTYRVEFDLYATDSVVEVRIALPIVGLQPIGMVDTRFASLHLVLLPSYRHAIPATEQARLLDECRLLLLATQEGR